MPKSNFTFDSNDNFPLIGCFYLNVDELFDRIDEIRKDPVDAKTYKVDPNFDMTKPF